MKLHATPLPNIQLRGYKAVRRLFYTIPIGVVLLAMCLIKVGGVHADVNNFVINNFDAKYVLTNTDKQGKLDVTETIDLTFSDNNHGILRAVPTTYKGNSLKVTGITVTSSTGAPAQFTTSESYENTVIKIGDPNKTVTGQQNYTIQYSISNVITFYDKYDEFYWDINGDQWQQPFDNVSMTLVYPAGAVLSSQNSPVCYTGNYNSTDKNCQITVDSATHTIAANTNAPLLSSQTMSVVVGFNKGYFTPVSAKEKLTEVTVILAETFGIPIVLGGLAFKRWRTKGRDPKGRGTIVAQYDAPKNMLPAEVGAIVDFKLENKDISATIIDLAIRKYVKIIETKTVKKLMPDTLEYSFVLTSLDTSGLTNYEKSLLEGLFKDTNLAVGSTVKATDLKTSYYTIVKSAKTDIINKLVTGGYFRSDPAKAGTILWVIVAISFSSLILFAFAFGIGIFLGILLSIPIVAAFAFAMPSRTKQGVEAKEHALGLKMYLEVAEKDRIAALQSPDAPLANNAHEPVKTVELFEKLLPYAIVFGVEKQWAQEFKDIYKQPPEWYAGNYNTFNAIYLSSALTSSFGESMNTAFAAPSSSGSSGFSGGGFSGGGGGGGGGGGW